MFQYDHNGRTALHYASHNGHVDCMRLLINDLKADMNARITGDDEANRQTPLSCAVRSFNPEAVRILLEAGADAKTTDHMGRTPLHHALSTSNRKLEIVE